ncbi:MAG: hypothetical protein IKE43_01670 [Coriobacteriales bacterium]|nr:hypothetical protein [Coriobacteriales bacterium]
MRASNYTLKHRSSFDLVRSDLETVPFEDAMRTAIRWLIVKESEYEGSPIKEDLSGSDALKRALDYAMPEDYTGGDYNDDTWPALACASARDETGNPSTWIMEYDEADASNTEHRWHTTLCLTREDEKTCRVAIEVSVRPIDPNAAPLAIVAAVPALARSLFTMAGCKPYKDGFLLERNPHKLTRDDFEQFAKELEDQNRSFPYVLFCTGLDGHMPEHAKQLARRSMGLTNTYVLDWSDEELRTMEQDLFMRGSSAGEYACPKSSCRVYMPGLNLSDPTRSMSHISFDRHALEGTLPTKFAETLVRRFIPNTPIPCIADMAK